jgi:hypothetical protein
MGLKDKKSASKKPVATNSASRGGRPVSSTIHIKRQDVPVNEPSDESDEDEDSEEDSEDGDEEDNEKEEDLAQVLYFYVKQLLEAGVCSTFPKAESAIKKLKEIVYQRSKDLPVLLSKALKRPASDTRVPPGSGLVQRQLDDDRFLLCMAAIMSSKILLAQGDSKAALHALREALIWFPRSIEANYLMAEIIRANAVDSDDAQLRGKGLGTEEGSAAAAAAGGGGDGGGATSAPAPAHGSLATVESLLLKAIETGVHLKEKFKQTVEACKAARTKLQQQQQQQQGGTAHKDDEEEEEEEEEGPLPEELVMEIEGEELIAAKSAQQTLSIVLCQQGRCNDAVPHLKAQGFTWRLARQVLHYPLSEGAGARVSALPGPGPGPKSGGSVTESAPPAPPAAATSSTTSSVTSNSAAVVQAFDSVLPAAAVQHLQHVFRPQSPYWSEHNYDTVLNASSTAGYYSYLFPLQERAPVCSVEQIIQQLIYPALCAQFPVAREAKYGKSVFGCE